MELHRSYRNEELAVGDIVRNIESGKGGRVLGFSDIYSNGVLYLHVCDDPRDGDFYFDPRDVVLVRKGGKK